MGIVPLRQRLRDDLQQDEKARTRVPPLRVPVIKSESKALVSGQAPFVKQERSLVPVPKHDRALAWRLRPNTLDLEMQQHEYDATALIPQVDRGAYNVRDDYRNSEVSPQVR